MRSIKDFRSRKEKFDIREASSRLGESIRNIAQDEEAGREDILQHLSSRVSSPDITEAENVVIREFLKNDIENIRLKSETPSAIKRKEQEFEASLPIKERMEYATERNKREFLERRLKNPTASLTETDIKLSQMLAEDVFKDRDAVSELRSQLDKATTPSIRRSLQESIEQLEGRAKGLQEQLTESGSVPDKEMFLTDEEKKQRDRGNWFGLQGKISDAMGSFFSKEAIAEEGEPQEDPEFGNMVLNMTNEAAERQRIEDEKALQNQETLAQLNVVKNKTNTTDDHKNVIELKTNRLLKMGVDPDQVVAQRDSDYRDLAIKLLVQQGKVVSQDQINKISKVLAARQSKV